MNEIKAVSPVAPCGIYCTLCPIYVADKGNHPKFKKILAHELKVAEDDIRCEYCLSDKPFIQCSQCAVRDCVIDKNIEGCYRCDDYQCSKIDAMDPLTKSWISRSIPAIKEMGIERFMEEEEKRCRCPNCDYQLFLGARKCRNCGNVVNLD